MDLQSVLPANKDSSGMASKPGESTEQQEAEIYMIGKFSEEAGHSLEPNRFALPNSGHTKVDGASEDPLVLCEAWAHIGKVRPAQKHKVMTDALKRGVLGTLVRQAVSEDSPLQR